MHAGGLLRFARSDRGMKNASLHQDPWEDRQKLAGPVLELRGISKSFGAIQALSDVDLSLEPGEVVGLMGDNGAGKSTLVKIIAGNFPPTDGEIRVEASRCISTSRSRRAEGASRSSIRTSRCATI